MESDMGDIRKELENRVTTTQKEIGALVEQREEIDRKLRKVDSELSALRAVYEAEARRFGERKPALFARKGVSYRFAGMRLIDALVAIRKEHPQIDKRGALEILQDDGFDFRGKRPLPAVHFAWVALERRKK